jgi:hypothetical protein
MLHCFRILPRLLSYRFTSARCPTSNLDNSASTPANHSTIISPMESFPGGPSPDSHSPLPPHAKPMNTRHQAAASTDDTTRELSSDLPPQPSENPTTGTRGHTLSDEHTEIAPDVRVATAPNGETADGLLRKEEGSAFVATRSPNRSLRTNDVGAERADATGTFTAVNGPSEVDPSRQPRATSVDDEPIKQMATIGKEERASSLIPLSFHCVHPQVRSIDARGRTHTDGVSRKLSKFEKRGAKAEKAALHVALQELAEIQELQTASIKVQ